MSVGFVLALVIVLIAMSAGLFIWQQVTTGPGFPTSPQEYVDAWKTYGENAFKAEDQPWRILSMFFFPFLFYFSMLYFAFNAAMIGLQRVGYYYTRNVNRPVAVLCFVMAFMQLPFPFTYFLYQFIGSLSPLMATFAWILPLVGIGLMFYGLRNLFPVSPPTTPPPETPRTVGAGVEARREAEDFRANVEAIVRDVIQTLRELEERLRGIIQSSQTGGQSG